MCGLLAERADRCRGTSGYTRCVAAKRSSKPSESHPCSARSPAHPKCVQIVSNPLDACDEPWELVGLDPLEILQWEIDMDATTGTQNEAEHFCQSRLLKGAVSWDTTSKRAATAHVMEQLIRVDFAVE
jgi:hypothetical protein